MYKLTIADKYVCHMNNVDIKRNSSIGVIYASNITLSSFNTNPTEIVKTFWNYYNHPIIDINIEINNDILFVPMAYLDGIGVDEVILSATDHKIIKISDIRCKYCISTPASINHDNFLSDISKMDTKEKLLRQIAYIPKHYNLHNTTKEAIEILKHHFPEKFFKIEHLLALS